MENTDNQNTQYHISHTKLFKSSFQGANTNKEKNKAARSCTAPGGVQLVKKVNRTFLTALLPPRILTVSQNAITRKSLIYQAFSDDGLLHSRRVFSRCGSVTARL